jgi:hypothetical protein
MVCRLHCPRLAQRKLFDVVLDDCVMLARQILHARRVIAAQAPEGQSSCTGLTNVYWKMRLCEARENGQAQVRVVSQAHVLIGSRYSLVTTIIPGGGRGGVMM